MVPNLLLFKTVREVDRKRQAVQRILQTKKIPENPMHPNTPLPNNISKLTLVSFFISHTKRAKINKHGIRTSSKR